MQVIKIHMYFAEPIDFNEKITLVKLTLMCQ